MRVKVLILCLILQTILFHNCVNAITIEENATNDKYERLIEIYSKDFIDNLTKEEYERIFYSDISKITVNYVNDNSKELSTFSAMHETSYKQLKIVNNNGYVTLLLSWKVQPKIRSYDVIGIRYDSGCSLNSFAFKQIYVKDNTTHISTSGDYKLDSSGLGLTFKLETGTVINSSLSFSVKGNCKIYGSYQHAQSNLSLNDAKDYKISATGLGRVFKFSKSTVANKYDAMAGVDMTI